MALLQEGEIREEIANVKLGFGLLEEKTGNYDKAMEFAQDALKIFERLGMKKEIEETHELVERLEREMAKGTKDAKEVKKFNVGGRRVQ
ncbi:MAG: hypothetical protein H8E47_01515 [Anaerolineales bacterium]|nr:hypothetical protein [Anaerolineales bacterium]